MEHQIVPDQKNISPVTTTDPIRHQKIPGGRPVGAASTSGWRPIGRAHAVVETEQRDTWKQRTASMGAVTTIGTICLLTVSVDGNYVDGPTSTMPPAGAAIG